MDSAITALCQRTTFTSAGFATAHHRISPWTRMAILVLLERVAYRLDRGMDFCGMGCSLEACSDIQLLGRLGIVRSLHPANSRSHGNHLGCLSRAVQLRRAILSAAND